VERRGRSSAQAGKRPTRGADPGAEPPRTGILAGGGRGILSVSAASAASAASAVFGKGRRPFSFRFNGRQSFPVQQFWRPRRSPPLQRSPAPRGVTSDVAGHPRSHLRGRLSFSASAALAAPTVAIISKVAGRTKPHPRRRLPTKVARERGQHPQRPAKVMFSGGPSLQAPLVRT